MKKPNGKSVRGPGRPEKPDIKLNASAEEVARRIFKYAKPVNPARRQTRKGK